MLLDPRTLNNAGCGGAAGLSVYLSLKSALKCPVILAGGITSENVSDIIKKVNPDIIDLMTGVESSPGIKDEKKIAALIKAVRVL